MNKKTSWVIASFLFFSATYVGADTFESTSTYRRCIVCHTMDKNLIGPSFKNIAAKYKNDTKGQKKLIKKLASEKVDTQTTWGNIPCVSNLISHKESKEIVDWLANIQ